MNLRLFAIAAITALSTLYTTASDLKERFLNPSSEARTKVWWFHGETASTEEGITADLESFREKGIGGVVYYDQVHGKGTGAAPAMSGEWWHMLKHAASEARRLGLSFEVAVGNGYVTGGPWITPELAMKKTAWTDTLVSIARKEGADIVIHSPDPKFRDAMTVIFPDTPEFAPLSFPDASFTVFGNDTIVRLDPGKESRICGLTYSMTARGKGSTGSMNIPGAPADRYFAAGYIDNPLAGQLEYSSDGVAWSKATDIIPLENNIGHKTRLRTLSFPAVTGRYFRLHIHDWRGEDTRRQYISFGDITLHTRDVVDNVEVKTGLRTEVTYPRRTGGETGVIDRSAVRLLATVTDSIGNATVRVPEGSWRIIRFGYVPTGARTKHGRKNLLGPEADVMSEQAATVQYRNYFKVILDTLASIGCHPAGMCMDSHEAGIQNWTQGFENRFRELRGYDLTPFIPAFAGYIVGSRELTDRALLDFRSAVAETIADRYYGTFARLCSNDGVAYTTQAMLNIETDNIAGRGRALKPQGEFWAYQTDGNYDCLDAASAAHLYGRGIASAEAFTDTPYETTWDGLLRIANIAYSRGINEFVVCASSHQPYSDTKYNDTASAHPYVFHRHHPRWDSARPFWDYQARCASMLRSGNPVVDLCVYLGEDPPLKTMSFRLPVIPQGYNFDVCTFDALSKRMSTSMGTIHVNGGMSYRAIIVGDRTDVSPEAESYLRALADKGAIVIRCDKGEDVGIRLAESGISPDIVINGEEPRTANVATDRLHFFHRNVSEGEIADIYFVYNHSPREFSHTITLRSATADAELWDPSSATCTPIDLSSPLSLPPYGSAFIVLYRRS